MTSPDRARSESVLAHGLMFEGKIEGDGSLRLAGRVTGQLKVTGQVTVERGGSIEGEVNADRVVLAGEAKARIHARSGVQIEESAAVIGDVEAENVSLAPGAKMKGTVLIGFPPTDTRSAHPGHTDGAPHRGA